MRRKKKTIECIEYLSVDAPLDKVDRLEDKQSKYIHEYVKNKEKVDSAKGEYISRLLTIKRGMESANTSFLFDKYKKIIKILKVFFCI